MVGGIKKVVVLAGKEDEFEKLFNQLRMAVRKDEPGNLYYDLYRVTHQPGHYRVLERYIDQDALDAHQNSIHGKDYFPKIRAILESLTVNYFESVESNNIVHVV